jgi:hypothetical protein
LSGWTLSDANAVSADGRTLTGTGTFKEGKEQAWVATLRAGVPAELRVTGPEITRVHATGFQVYTWEATSGWKFKCPDATFEGSHGMRGKHYAGPKWECTNDGSKVGARPIAEHAAEGDAVKWLLLKADYNDGNGVLSAVTYIQRINTTGGTKPSSVNAKDGDEARVPYTADYVFFGPGAKPTIAAR